MRRRAVVAGMAFAAVVPIGGRARRRSVHERVRWDELPANSAVTIAALMADTDRGHVTPARLGAGASEPPRDRGGP